MMLGDRQQLNSRLSIALQVLEDERSCRQSVNVASFLIETSEEFMDAVNWLLALPIPEQDQSTLFDQLVNFGDNNHVC